MAEGFKDFAPGDILTAADVDDYLMRQAVMRFDDASARTTALSGVLVEGMMSYLKDTNTVEVYDGSAWVGVGGVGTANFTDTETGTYTDGGTDYKYLTFTASGTITIDTAGLAKVLVIGGGGGGGYQNGGGGGAAAYVEMTDAYLPVGTLTVRVGAGGATQKPGNVSGAHLYLAPGGGAGGRQNNSASGATSGGSGGGGQMSGSGASGTAGLGNNGGNGYQGSFPNWQGGGGGGSGGNGINGASNNAGNGGAGTSSSITGAAVTRAGGGGGGSADNDRGTGSAGGGNGGNGTSVGGNATANTGSGGGGGADIAQGGNGGSGIVIVAVEV